MIKKINLVPSVSSLEISDYVVVAKKASFKFIFCNSYICLMATILGLLKNYNDQV